MTRLVSRRRNECRLKVRGKNTTKERKEKKRSKRGLEEGMRGYKNGKSSWREGRTKLQEGALSQRIINLKKKKKAMVGSSNG